MTNDELFAGLCDCGHSDLRHDRTKLTSNARARAAYDSDTYPCEDCTCIDYWFPIEPSAEEQDYLAEKQRYDDFMSQYR